MLQFQGFHMFSLLVIYNTFKLNCCLCRGAVEAYSVEIGNVGRKLLGSISLIMGLESNDLPELHKEMQISMRVNYYPVCYEPEKVMGMSPHSDATTITILLQDNNVNGLQIRHNGGWVPVQPVPNSLIVNVGDVLEVYLEQKFTAVLAIKIYWEDFDLMRPSHGRQQFILIPF